MFEFGWDAIIQIANRNQQILEEYSSCHEHHTIVEALLKDIFDVDPYTNPQGHRWLDYLIWAHGKLASLPNSHEFPLVYCSFSFLHDDHNGQSYQGNKTKDDKVPYWSTIHKDWVFLERKVDCDGNDLAMVLEFEKPPYEVIVFCAGESYALNENSCAYWMQPTNMFYLSSAMIPKFPIDDFLASFTNTLFHETTHLLDIMEFRGSDVLPGQKVIDYSEDGDGAYEWKQVKDLAPVVIGHPMSPVGPFHPAIWNAQSITYFALILFLVVDGGFTYDGDAGILLFPSRALPLPKPGHMKEKPLRKILKELKKKPHVPKKPDYLRAKSHS
ncbi:hypothetical protein NUU61_003531 [Penicillium alfredii]|uniref:Lysine-specific metallo-endopeptidase domain-containing protein n=1 Tax=Penicillium alfredii TaxID=1506179 RepID=A0A9W9KCJ7_9EURO|nr:uncharacterized protein NUU61_003531 [Penicillium alfredii]KAJ5101309.1 hypothetical protein NUU61_003531 [Penicillium alfredii]